MSGITGGIPPLITLAAHPVRWALMRELAVSDRRVRELVAAVGEPQNLVSYHLRVLRTAGLVGARRSSFDGRDSYYHLDLAVCAQSFAEAATALHPALRPSPARHRDRRSVLFLCTGNSARSPMAEALLRHRVEGIVVASAGSHPAERTHPAVRRVLREEFGIEFAARRPRSLTEFAGRDFERVITLCDKVREFLRERGMPVAAHWSLPDPVATLRPGQRAYREFRSLARELDSRIDYLARH